MGEFTDALRRQGLINTLPAEDFTVRLTNTNRHLANVLRADVELFAYEVDAAIKNMHPAVKELIVRKSNDVLSAMRSALIETKTGFGGMTGSAKALDFRISWPYDYYNPDLIGGLRRTWTRYISTISTVGTPTPFITGSVVSVGTAVDYVTAEEESLLFLGFMNRAGVDPKSTAYQIIYNTEKMNYEPLNFDLSEAKEQGILMHEMPQSVLIPPEQKIQINVRYDELGTDYLTPIVFRFRQASDSRTL